MDRPAAKCAACTGADGRPIRQVMVYQPTLVGQVTTAYCPACERPYAIVFTADPQANTAPGVSVPPAAEPEGSARTGPLAHLTGWLRRLGGQR